MFETNENAEIKVIENIKGRSAVIIDDFYKNPDEVRDLALSLEYKDRNVSSLVGGFPGSRSFLDTLEVKEKLYETYLDLCTDKLWEIPGRGRLNLIDFNSNWNKQGFMVNVTNDDLLIKDPLYIMPHQDYFEDEEPTYQFGSVIYLNTSDECVAGGGTSLYSYKGEMSVRNRKQLFGPGRKSWMQECLKKESDIEKFKYIKSNLDRGVPYTIEFEAEMKYNRMFLYPAEVLHMANVDLGMFANYNRMNQILFM
jgi:hypothetical protein